MMEGNLSIESERATQAKIEAQLAEASHELSECDARRETLAFGALSGDSASKKSLVSLDAEETRLTLAVKTAEKALKESKRRVALAEAALGDAEDRALAQEALDVVDEAHALAIAADKALMEAIEKLDALSGVARILSAKGYPLAAGPMVETMIKSAIVTRFQFTTWRIGFNAPDERHEIPDVVKAWAAALRRRATERLARPAVTAPQKAA
jgi:hypothetical protein